MGKLKAYEGRRDRYLECFKPYVNNASVVVDLGCGSGIFSKALADGKRVVIALDIQKQLLRGTEGTTLERICADAHNLPLRESSLECVLSFSLIERLQKPAEHVKELYRVLRRGGVAIIQLPNIQYLFEPHSKWPLLCLMPEKFQSKVFEAINYPYVNMKVTVKHVLTLLCKSGFSVNQITKLYHTSIMRMLPMAPSYMFVAEKRC
jgi:SAM-dependent methyltransferase